MFAALRVSDVKASEKYYTQLLGMKRFQYPKYVVWGGAYVVIISKLTG